MCAWHIQLTSSIPQQRQDGNFLLPSTANAHAVLQNAMAAAYVVLLWGALEHFCTGKES
jgi:hypothetical protein